MTLNFLSKFPPFCFLRRHRKHARSNSLLAELCHFTCFPRSSKIFHGEFPFKIDRGLFAQLPISRLMERHQKLDIMLMKKVAYIKAILSPLSFISYVK